MINELKKSRLFFTGVFSKWLNFRYLLNKYQLFTCYSKISIYLSYSKISVYFKNILNIKIEKNYFSIIVFLKIHLLISGKKKAIC